MAPCAALWFILKPRRKVYGEFPVDIIHQFFGHTSIKVYAVVMVEVVIVDGLNHMIRCNKTLATQVSAFLHEYGFRGVVFLLLFLLGTPGSHEISILFPSLPPHP